MLTFGRFFNQTDRTIQEDFSQEQEVFLNMRTTRLMGAIAGGSIAFVALFSGISSDRVWVRVVCSSGFLTGVSFAVGSHAFSRYAAYDIRRFVDGKLAIVNQLEQKVIQWNSYYAQQSQGWKSQLSQLQAQTQQQKDFYENQIAILELEKSELAREFALYDGNIEAAAQDANRLESQIERLQEEKARLTESHQQAIAHLQSDWERKYADILSSLEQSQEAQNQALSEMVKHCKFSIFQAIAEWHKRLASVLDSARLHGSTPELSELHDELLQIQSDHNHRVDSYTPSGNLSQTADQLLSLLHHAGREYAALSTKIQIATTTGANTSALTQAHAQVSALQSQLESIKAQQLIPLTQHQQQIQQLKEQKDQALSQLLTQLDELEQAAQSNPMQQEAIARIEKLESHNQALQSRVRELSAPILYRPAIREDLKMSNAIAHYFAAQGIILDRAYSDYHKWKATLYFHIDRNPQIVLEKELNEHSEKLTQLINTLTDPKFVFDKGQGLMAVDLQLAHKPPTDVAEVNMLWKTADKFATIAAKISPRIRITGGSEGGKSPTAENLAVCILMARKKAGIPYRARVGNPMHNSKKNFWSLPQIWKSHAENLQALKEMKAHLEARASGAESRELFDLYLFDETDSTISQYGKSATDLIFFGLKQVSHQNMGLVLIGQSPNASNYNSQRADWENAISIHIGTAAKHAIEKDDTLTADDKNALKKQADIIANYCAEQNKKNGFRTEGDSQTSQGYRYAWVREPNKHYWIQLPEFGCYQYHDLDSVHPQSASASEVVSELHPAASTVHPEAGNPDSSVASEVPSPTYLGMQCPKCHAGILTSTKKNRGKILYLCNDCGKSTSESVLNRQYRQKLEDLLPDEETGNDDD